MADDVYLTDGLMIPEANGTDPVAPYWHWLQQHQLRVQQCRECGTAQNPAESLCHACYSTEFEWIELEPRGQIFSWTRVWHPVHDLLIGKTPYLLVWVEIDHPARPRFLGNLVGDPQQDVALGMSVTGIFEDHETGTLLQWVAE